MTAFRILVVDDEPDLRKVVERSLARDPQLAVRSCACGEDALAQAADWSPDVILCDVMMPVMDGPTTLARLRESPRTAEIPVVFMTARSRPGEIEGFMSIGASGVIAKPFDPKSLAKTVRGYLPAAATPGDQRASNAVGKRLPVGAVVPSETREFRERLRTDGATLRKFQAALRTDGASSSTLDELRSCAHKLAGAAGLYGFPIVSGAASALEGAIVAGRAGRGKPGDIEADLDALVDDIERE